MKKLFLIVLLSLFALPARADLPVMPSFAPLVKKTSPAVVNIYAKRIVREQMRAFFNDPFFNQFFNAPEFVGPTRERLQNSLGSGVIVGGEGTIATNHHVIADATEINVVLADGREFTAKKLLDDARTDLAILKIDAKTEKLPALELADSDAVEVGDIVIAIGNPFGVGQTVTSGIVSAVARTDVGISDYSFFIQTDAAINPGNSGGALVDAQGRLIGINSAIFSKDGGSLGIGFAIPANMLRAVLHMAQNGGEIRRPWTGLTGQSVTPDMVESLGLKAARGALINSVYRDGPADKAGLKAGDVILAINGKDVLGPAALRFRLATVALGDDITLSVFRAGKTFDAVMKAEAAPETPPRDELSILGAGPLAGTTVVNISPAVSEELGTLSAESGVVIAKVEGGPAARLGLKPGDIPLVVNDEKINSTRQLKSLLEIPARGWRMEIKRGRQVIDLAVR